MHGEIPRKKQFKNRTKAQGTLWEREWNYRKRQRIGELPVRFCLLVMSELSHTVSPTWLPNQELNRDDGTDTLMWAGENHEESVLLNRQPRKAGIRRGGLPKRGADQLSIQFKWPALRTYIHVTLYALSWLYLYLGIHIYIRIHTRM